MKITWKSLLIAIIAFLLVGVVFFMYTTTTSSPTVMELKIPKDRNENTGDESSGSTLTLLLLKNNMVYSYYENDLTNGRKNELKNIRSIILDGVQRFTRDSLVVLIKISKDASYRNTVDILDEMTINDIKKYRMIDLNKTEENLLAKAE
jgi:biopolymer transport protein ExbD